MNTTASSNSKSKRPLAAVHHSTTTTTTTTTTTSRRREGKSHRLKVVLVAFFGASLLIHNLVSNFWAAQETTRTQSESESESVARLTAKNNNSNNARQVVQDASTTKLKILHVTSPYAVALKKDNPDTRNRFFPIDQVQNMTFASMKRAQRYAHASSSLQQQGSSSSSSFSVEVTLAAAVLPVDRAAALIPDMFDYVIPLSRSVATEYPHLQHQIQASSGGNNNKTVKELPFVQDILTGALRLLDINNNEVNYDYLVLTNSDIGVVESFYTSLVETILPNNKDTTTTTSTTPSSLSRGGPSSSYYKAITINKRIISEDRLVVEGGDNNSSTAPSPPPFSDWSGTYHALDAIYEQMPTAGLHPGYDCFVVRKDVLPNIDMGDLFLGYPPWGYVLHTVLNEVVSPEQYHAYLSSVDLTFHLGDEERWRSEGDNTLGKEGRPALPRATRYKFCRRPKNAVREFLNPYTYQNQINCIEIANNQSLNVGMSLKEEDGSIAIRKS